MIELISDLPPRFREIGSATTDQQPEDNVSEDGQQVRSMPRTNLGMLLPHGRIAAGGQSILNPQWPRVNASKRWGAGT